jgi:5-methylcytosine-specific restriction endonuclease McrA
MLIKHNSEYYPRCQACDRKYNRERARKLRLKAQKKELLQNSKLEKTGWKRCSNCFKKKTLFEFSTRYGKRGGKLHKICDTCLSRLLASNRKDMDQFTPKFWRSRAYACNSTYRYHQKRLKQRVVPLADLAYVIKPQQLVELYKKQDGKCCYCYVTLTTRNLSCDHAIAIVNQGSHHIRNIRLTCRDCNNLKWTRNENEFVEFLRVYAQRILEVSELRDKEPAR